MLMYPSHFLQTSGTASLGPTAVRGSNGLRYAMYAAHSFLLESGEQLTHMFFFHFTRPGTLGSGCKELCKDQSHDERVSMASERNHS